MFTTFKSQKFKFPFYFKGKSALKLIKCFAANYLGNKCEIIKSASSGVGGADFLSGGTGSAEFWSAISCVGWKSGTNLQALQQNKEIVGLSHSQFRISSADDSQIMENPFTLI